MVNKTAVRNPSIVNKDVSFLRNSPTYENVNCLLYQEISDKMGFHEF